MTEINPIDEYYHDKPIWYREMIKRHTHAEIVFSQNPDMIVYEEQDVLDIVDVALIEQKKELDKKHKSRKWEILLSILLILGLVGCLCAFLYIKNNI